jgi:hypothetical protein
MHDPDYVLDSYGLTPAVVAEHDLGDAIPAGGHPALATPVQYDKLIGKPPRTWVWGGEVMGA